MGQKQDLPTALREFIGEFEHTTYRMLQMLDSRPHDHEHIGLWCDFAYRLATYALVSFWIDDKTEQSVVCMEFAVDLDTGKTVEVKTTTFSEPMRVPRKYKKAAKRR